jgi:hypothetical protein
MQTVHDERLTEWWPCPHCRAVAARATLGTHNGTYMRCEMCGELWHLDRRADPSTPGRGERRVTDRGVLSML